MAVRLAFYPLEYNVDPLCNEMAAEHRPTNKYNIKLLLDSWLEHQAYPSMSVQRHKKFTIEIHITVKHARLAKMGHYYAAVGRFGDDIPSLQMTSSSYHSGSSY